MAAEGEEAPPGAVDGADAGSPAADAGDEEPPQKPQDAGSKGLLHFLDREDLHDCTVKLDEQNPDAKEFKCHRVVLCSCSRYFYERFITSETPAAAGSAVGLPALPEDSEVKRQVDLASSFPIALAYAYSGQRWEAIIDQVTRANAIGLFAIAALLGMPKLADETFKFLGDPALDAATVTRLLYTSITLASNGNAEGFADVQNHCLEELKRRFSAACETTEDRDLICRLPTDVLVQLLGSDDLSVTSEGTVLDVVKTILERRLGNAPGSLTFHSIRLTEAGEVFSKLTEQATNGAVWEAEISEAGKPQTVATSAQKLVQNDAGDIAVDQELKLTAPAKADANMQVTLRARAAGTSGAGQVLFTGTVPLEKLMASENQEAEHSVEVQMPNGEKCGVVHLKCRHEAGGDKKESEGGEGAEGDEAKQSQEAAKVEEAKKLLDAVRFPHLTHEELFQAASWAASDPVLVEAGAQQKVLQALSAKLERHEHADSAAKALAEQPTQLPRRARAPQTAPLSPDGARRHAYDAASPARRHIMALHDAAGSVQASAEKPLSFERRNGDFDEGGALYWLGTSGQTQVWRNPMSMGCVHALAGNTQVLVYLQDQNAWKPHQNAWTASSGVGFGKLEDVVGRKAVNLRSGNSPGSYFGVDLLGDRLLVVQGYCLRNRSSATAQSGIAYTGVTATAAATSHNLTSWVLQGSIDGQTWTNIDQREDKFSLQRAGATAYFEVDNTGVAYRCFRVVQAALHSDQLVRAVNSSGSDNLCLSGIELYGYAIAGSWP
jgi:hypothetical protein